MHEPAATTRLSPIPVSASPGATQQQDLRLVPGPSAFGGSDRRRFWELLWIVSATEFRLTYANTALGFLWTVVKPLLFFGVIFVVLRGVLRVGANIPNYPLILVLGLILFQYFQETTNRSVRCIPSRENMIRKMQFPRIIIPLSISATAAFTMVLNLLAVVPIFIGYGVTPELEWLLVIPVLLVLIAYSTSLGLALSVLFIRFEDVNQIWSLISRVLFYASPVIFPIELVPEPFRQIMSLNPLAPLIELARVFIIDPTAPGPADISGWLLGVIVPGTLIVVTGVFSFWLFKREAPLVAEAL